MDHWVSDCPGHLAVLPLVAKCMLGIGSSVGVSGVHDLFHALSRCITKSLHPLELRISLMQ